MEIKDRINFQFATTGDHKETSITDSQRESPMTEAPRLESKTNDDGI